ncbi:MAG: type II secretion system protein [Sulfuritalea sp.]|nr:type II secretion system protein [Sulfuritalea sp.]
MYARSRQHGVTLIELIVFIVIVGVALTGMLTVLNLTGRSGADPMIRKQMLAIAEGLMDEVAAQPFTWCDPNDPAAATAISAAVCATPEVMGFEAGETRGGAVTPFDNVNDYNGLAGISTSITGTAMPAGYTAAITVAPSALGPAASLVPAAASLLITVTVSFNTENLTIEGYRTRYAPNSLP